MKFLVIAIAFAMFVSAQALTDAQKEEVRGLAKKCTSETGVDTDTLKKMRSGDYDIVDSKLNSYVFCMMKKTGVMNDDGVFNKDAAMAKVADDVKDVVSKAIDTCLKETADTNEEKAFKYLKCYHKERPNHDFI